MIRLKNVIPHPRPPVRTGTGGLSLKRGELTFLLIIMLFSLAGCKKEEPISNSPEIEFVSISPASVKEFADEINIVISYKDNDGDLGENDPNVNNLFVTDNRNGIVYTFRVQQLAPSNSEISIKGNLDIKLNNSSITNGSSSQSVDYSIYMNDRARNKSNEVKTSAITVVK